MRLVQCRDRYIYSSLEDAEAARLRWWNEGGERVYHMLALDAEVSGMWSVQVSDCRVKGPMSVGAVIGYLA